jgi:hypothetical protein
MLKAQTKIYLGEDGFCWGPDLQRLNPRADYLRGVTSRLEGVNPWETRGWAALQEKQSL